MTHEKPRGHYIDEAERLALLVRKHRDRFSAAHRAAAENILFWVQIDPRAIRIDPAIGTALAEIHEAAEAMEMGLIE